MMTTEGFVVNGTTLSWFVGDVDKRKSAYMRFGRSMNADEVDLEKRKSAYMRFGKRQEAEDADTAGFVDKRKSAYMRWEA